MHYAHGNVGRCGGIEPEQFALFVGSNYVLTFQERCGDVFDPVRNRVRHVGANLRCSGPSYLAYALLDAVIDGYYPILEAFGENLEALEDEIAASPSRQRSIRSIRPSVTCWRFAGQSGPT